jgi:mannose-6-phosphate isomerase
MNDDSRRGEHRMKEAYGRIHLLDNTVQNYAWGSYTGFSKYLGIEQAPDKPSAELWMGAHPQAPSMLIEPTGAKIPLDKFIEADPDGSLGGKAARAFGGLPFLFKVLSASMPLSIQVHPTKTRAEAGFAREEQAHIPRNAPERNYKDPNHKPELAVALSPFTVICGFRKPAEIEQLLGPDLCRLLGFSAADWPGSAFTLVHGALSRHEHEKLVLESIVRDRARVLSSSLENSTRLAASIVLKLYDYYPHDTGALSPFFLDIFELSPGQGLFIPAGVMHAYIEGTILEIMATSDNVLRGGLTQKHIDVEELLSCILPDAHPNVVLPHGIEKSNDDSRIESEELFWETPTREFRLSKVRIGKGKVISRSLDGPEIVLCEQGEINIGTTMTDTSENLSKAGNSSIELSSGMSAFIPAGCGIYYLEGEGTIFRAASGLAREALK